MNATTFNTKLYGDPIWKLMNNNTTIKGNAMDYENRHCIYLDLEDQIKSFKNLDGNDIYQVTIKYNGEYNGGCIGVTSEKDEDWILNGMSDHAIWPKVGVYSYFDGSREHPYWKNNELITMQFNIDSYMVYYFKTNRKNQTKLIKKESLSRPSSSLVCNVTDGNKIKYHFMLTAWPCADDSYSIC